MKRGILLFLTLSVGSTALYAQSGNVGIGTTTPASKLTVSGNSSVGAGYAGTAAPANGAIIEGNVGIGTTTPASKLHVAGGVQIVDGTQGAGKLFVSNAAGLGSWQDPSQSKEILALGNATTQSVLTSVSAGGSATLINFTQLVNTITGATFNTATDAVTLPAGTYEVSVSYELTATAGAAAVQVNSYFIDFPNNGTSIRIHANSPSISGGNSVHSALWVTTIVIPAGGQSWTMHIGRGVGGNYFTTADVATTSRVLVKKIL
jgi:hypothetical protein